MTTLDIVTQRLHNQHLIGLRCTTPEAVVQWLGAVQAQDYAGAKWAIAQRTTGATNAALDQLFNDGKLLRTHVLRPTWHSVLPADIRWLQKLTAPRVLATMAYYDRKLELDEAVFQRSHAALAAALQDGAQLTRTELGQVYGRAGITASGQRLGHLVMHAELNGLICSGALRGKQFTYAWLDARVPPTKPLDRDEALAELTRRYFTSHGPALVQDFTWWSGLTATDAKAGIELAKPQLLSQTINGKTYWFTDTLHTAPLQTPTIHLLPNYDEYTVAYKDHRASFDSSLFKFNSTALLAHIVVLNGQVVGGWRRTIQKQAAIITTDLVVQLKRDEQAALRAAAEQYGQFLGVAVTVV